MSKINEILTSIILYSIISYIFLLPDLKYSLILAILGSQINILFPDNYKHTLILYIPLFLFLILYPAVMMPIMVGYSSSVFIQLLSKEGCKLLYPLRETTFTGPKNYLENNTKEEYAATVFLITLMIITLLLSFNGTELLDDLNKDNDNYFSNHENRQVTSPEVVQYININPANTLNRNITSIKTENSTTTLITEYEKKK